MINRQYDKITRIFKLNVFSSQVGNKEYFYNFLNYNLDFLFNLHILFSTTLFVFL